MSTKPFWIEIDRSRLRKNLETIQMDMPETLSWCSVVKDQAYGHGAVLVAKETERFGAKMVAVATVDEALELKGAGVQIPIMIFGERSDFELETCVENDFVLFANTLSRSRDFDRVAKRFQKKLRVHTNIDTGMGRYGVRWTNAGKVCFSMKDFDSLSWGGAMTHFAMSDESDKTYANLQTERFENAVQIVRENVALPSDFIFHACNTGGYLDLPHAHFDMVRMGILPLGVYPSKVCRRIEGLRPVLSAKTRVAHIKQIQKGDCVGYGMHYQAKENRTIAVLPVGYSSGFPRLRNQGYVLVHGERAPVIGGNAMNATMVDITKIPQVQTWDEVVLVGQQGEREISIHDLAAWKSTVSYDIFTRLSNKFPAHIVG